MASQRQLAVHAFCGHQRATATSCARHALAMREAAHLPTLAQHLPGRINQLDAIVLDRVVRSRDHDARGLPKLA